MEDKESQENTERKPEEQQQNKEPVKSEKEEQKKENAEEIKKQEENQSANENKNDEQYEEDDEQYDQDEQSEDDDRARKPQKLQSSDDDFEVDEEQQKQAKIFKSYLNQSGISVAFQIIFAQVVDKGISQKQAFNYTAHRLRQIGDDLEKMKAMHAKKR